MSEAEASAAAARPLLAHALGLAVVTACALVVGWPLLVHGYPASAHDAQYHSQWTVAFTQQMGEGEAWPRWLTTLNDGLGSPSFFFYAPLPYWVNGLLRPLLGWQASCWTVLGVSSFLALLTSGLFALCWLRRICPLQGAVFGACLYMVAPYHLLDLYERGAFAETWAMVWMPAVMWALCGVAERPARAVPLLATAYAALILTHLPTTLVFSAVPLAWAVARGRRTLAPVVVAMGLGIGLASAYLFPALGLRHAVTIDQLKPSEYAQWFLPPWSGGQAETEAFRWRLLAMAASTFAVALTGFLMAATAPAESSARSSERAFWMGIAVAAVFMCTGWSTPLWRILPVLQTVQFPWRFLTVLTLAASALSALGVARPTRAAAWAGLLAAGLLAWYWIPVDLRMAARAREAAPQDAPDMQVDAPEYTPDGRRASLAIVHGRVARPDGTVPAAVLFAAGRIDSQRHGARHYTFLVDVEQDAVMWISQLWFPGWSATLDGQRWPVERNQAMGLPQLRVPAGRHVIEVRLAPTGPEIVGWCITAASLGMLGAFLISGRGRRCRVGDAFEDHPCGPRGVRPPDGQI